MYDYFKIWIDDKSQIDKIVNSPLLSFTGLFDKSTGEVIDYPVLAKWNVFELKLKSATRLQVSGSLHKFWNNGTNENDFTFDNVLSAIKDFCDSLNLNPNLATIHNLEFGVNIRPEYPANEIIDQIICFKNKRPLRPYEGNDEQFFFIEFSKSEYYFKVYDKGRQYNTINTVRTEVKAMRSRELKQVGASTLNDLMNKEVFELLGRKLMQFVGYIIFDDSTINFKRLEKKDKDIYRELRNPNNWVIRGRKSTTQYRRERRFAEIVNQYGKWKIYTYIQRLVAEKVAELTNEVCNIPLSKYTDETLQKRVCLSCGKDISHQGKRTKFCSSKFVGKEAAHRCRNTDSNPRNNLKNKLKRIIGRGVLFDIGPFLIDKYNKKQVYGI